MRRRARDASALVASVTLLGAFVGCGRSVTSGRGHDGLPRHASDSQLHFLPGGVRALASGQIAPGRRFVIVAKRYRFGGRLYFDLAARIDERGAPAGGGEGDFSPDHPSEPLEWSAEDGCETHPSVSWSVVYGLLRQAGARASARTQRRTYRLRAVAIPGSFQQPGRVAYALLPEQPSEMTVSARDGHTVMNEKLDAPHRERCNPRETSSLMVFSAAPKH